MADKLDLTLLRAVQHGIAKSAFVPMPGGQSEPVAGASAMTAGMAAPMGGGAPPPEGGAPMGATPPMDPAMMGMDPATGAPMGGAPIDPAMMGAPPADPAAAGGAPPEGEDPITAVVDALIEQLTPIIEKAVQDAVKANMPPPPAPAAPAAPKEPKAAPAAEPQADDGQAALLDEIRQTNTLLRQALGGG